MLSLPKVSVLAATYNRAETLRRTLAAFQELDCSGLRAEFVIVDNNSTDSTRSVVDSFRGFLPVRYLFEPRQGKSCALNRALREVELGDIVVLADDDVIPEPNWLQAIVASCRKWSDYSVFGGKVTLLWPEGVHVPAWALENRFLQGILFCPSDMEDYSCEYPPGKCPAGANSWIRREVLSGQRRFDESMGPGRRFKMGEDTLFFLRLRDDGYRIMYVPDAVVRHRVQPSLFSRRAARRRAYCHGRGVAYKQERGRPVNEGYSFLHKTRRIISIARWYVYGIWTLCCPLCTSRFEKSVKAQWFVGYNVELYALMRKR